MNPTVVIAIGAAVMLFAVLANLFLSTDTGRDTPAARLIMILIGVVAAVVLVRVLVSHPSAGAGGNGSGHDLKGDPRSLLFSLFLLFCAYKYGVKPRVIRSDFRESWVSRQPVWVLRVMGIAFLVFSLIFFVSFFRE